MLPRAKSLQVSHSLTSKCGFQALQHLPPQPLNTASLAFDSKLVTGVFCPLGPCHLSPSSELAALQLLWVSLAQPAGEGGEKSGRLQAERALMSTCFTFPTLHGNSKPNPMGIVFLKIWDGFGTSLSFFAFFFYYVCFWTAAISSVLELSSSRGGEKMKFQSNAEKIFL